MRYFLHRRGQSLVEFIIVFPFLIFFLVFSFYAFLTFCDYLTLQQMTREALRQASIETVVPSEITPEITQGVTAKVDASGYLLAYTRGTVNILSRVNDAPPTSTGPGNSAVKKFYEKSYRVAVTIDKNSDVPNVLGFMDFLGTDKDKLQFPPQQLSYTLDMRPEL